MVLAGDGVDDEVLRVWARALRGTGGLVICTGVGNQGVASVRLDPLSDEQVALLVGHALDELGLRGYPKTSGSDGIHVLVPIERRYTYADTRDFSSVVASAIALSNPGLATTEWKKSNRRGVLIDANQNGQGKTIASAYSVRPGPGAPVSTPLRWDEVNETLDPLAFTMDVVLERVRREGDLFRPVLDELQRLPK